MTVLKSLLLYLMFFSSGDSLRILGYFPIPAHSHQQVLNRIGQAFARKGHEVVIATTNPTGGKIGNLTEIDISAAYKYFDNQSNDFTHISVNFLPSLLTVGLSGMIITDCHLLQLGTNTEGFQELMKKDENYFDLILVESIFLPIYAIQSRFKAPLVGISPTINLNNFNQELGNFNHPLLYPDILSGYNKVTTFGERVDSTLVNIGYYVLFKYFFNYRADRCARKIFGNDIAYIEEYIKNASMVFEYSSQIFTDGRPTAPNVKRFFFGNSINESLPEDLKLVMDKSSKGVVYFSLGTSVQLAKVNPTFKTKILEVLKNLPFTVLCKWENSNLTDLPKNIVFRKWFPQSAVLAHPNLKVFITQGGIHSSHEAVINAVPVVVIPFIADQPTIAKKFVDHGLGIALHPQKFTGESLTAAIIEVATNKSYKLNAIEAQQLIRDNPMDGIDKVIWWSEYVVRHKGAKHLRKYRREFPLYQYYLIDVLLFISLVLLLCLYVTFVILRRMLRMFGNKQKTD